jgi:hypothetical protein
MDKIEEIDDSIIYKKYIKEVNEYFNNLRKNNTLRKNNNIQYRTTPKIRD